MSLNISFISFKLNNVLCVPHIFRNILSLSQLCLDNPILINFFSSSFLIKDLSTQAILLQGSTKNGVYNCLFSSPTTFSVGKTSTASWHHKLGHDYEFIIFLFLLLVLTILIIVTLAKLIKVTSYLFMIPCLSLMLLLI